ncbi:MAG: glycosyltransferase [Acidobacteriia bacterium]|nr:glycosyltransferase [Terriglobia bacterium]
MRILTLNANLKGVGTYQRCFYFSRELARAGHQVTMATVSRVSKYRSHTYYKCDWVGEHVQPGGNGGPWVRMIEGPNLGYKWLPGWGSGPLDILLRTRELAGATYDIVYGFEYQPNVSWPVYLTKRFHEYAYFSDWCDWHSGQSSTLRGLHLAHRVDRFFEERIRFSARKVTVISATLRDRAISIGVPSDRVEWVKQGIDTDYVGAYPQSEMRARFGILSDVPVLAASCDGDMLDYIRILQRVVRRAPEALLIVIGTVPKNARRLAEELGLSRSLRWTGWLSDEDYPRYLACADLCVIPLANTLLNRARFPGKILDYLAAGRAVVTNDIGEVGPIFRQNEVGRLLPHDEEEFAAGIVKLLRDPDLCRDLGARARQLAVQQWDWRMRGSQIAGIVES